MGIFGWDCRHRWIDCSKILDNYITRVSSCVSKLSNFGSSHQFSSSNEIHRTKYCIFFLYSLKNYWKSIDQLRFKWETKMTKKLIKIEMERDSLSQKWGITIQVTSCSDWSRVKMKACDWSGRGWPLPHRQGGQRQEVLPRGQGRAREDGLCLDRQWKRGAGIENIYT